MVPCLSMKYKLLLILPISCYAIFDIFKLRKMIEIIQLKKSYTNFNLSRHSTSRKKPEEKPSLDIEGKEEEKTSSLEKERREK